ncbi:MAG: signal recognition particle-docking protein FtsY [Trichloromonadaceae bacterium]
MEQLSQLLTRIASMLASLGVPEAYLDSAALGVIYILATLVVLLLLAPVLLRRRPQPPVVVEPPVPQPQDEAVEETTTVAAEEPEPEIPTEEIVEPAEAELAQPAPVVEIPAPPAVAPAPVVKPAPEQPMPVTAPPSLFERMRSGLSKTSSSLVGRIDSLLRGRQVDEELLEELEEILITADLGMKTTQELMQALNKRRARGEAQTPEALRTVLMEEIRLRLTLDVPALDLTQTKPMVLMVVGVNGVGKTTTIGKLANQFSNQGLKVLLGAGDTFRAAAADQLAVWGERAGVEVVRHAEGADPAAVAYDAAKAAVARKVDVLILDTAGRLHTKVNLMEEMKKIRRVLAREIPDAPHETLLVLDATTGQNALVQARMFKETVEITGLVLTKLDGTARGGIVVAIASELGVPVRYVGIGEGLEDLRPFEPELFVRALFGRE